MPEPQRASVGHITEALQSFSFEVRADISERVPELAIFEASTESCEALLMPVLAESSRLTESPDDLFSQRFGVSSHGRLSFDPQVAALLDAAILQVVSDGLFDLASAEEQGVSIRRGGAGSVSGELSVRWISYTEAQTEASLLPDFNALIAVTSVGCSESEIEVQGVERFTTAEVRVLMLGEDDDVALGVFVPSACRGEAIDHFLKALSGSGEPSFLYNALEREMVRVLDGDTALDSKDYLELLTWFRANLAWSVVRLEEAVSYNVHTESVVIELMMKDHVGYDFSGAFGTPTLRCNVSFGSPKGALVERPLFEWLHERKA